MGQREYKILLVDDEPDILEFLGYNLKKEGYQVFSASNGKDAIQLARVEIPHLVLLDVMMPEMDGMETCRQMREIPALKNTIISFLTARNEDYSQIAGFEAGADDYVSKPVRPRVLASRIKALLKRNVDVGAEGTTLVSKQGIVIDKDRYVVLKDGKEMTLPRKEFELLALLAGSPGKVFTRDFILDKIWGGDVIVGDRTVDVHVSKLRDKVGEQYIRTIKGIGYKFES